MQFLKPRPVLVPRLLQRGPCSDVLVSSARKPKLGTKAKQTAGAMSHILRENPALYRKVTQAALELKQHGWTVINGVLSAEECSSYLDGCWTWLENLGTGIKRDDPSTWDDSRWPPAFKGIINTLGVAHQDFVWQVRGNPNVVQVFELLLGTNELLTSFDSINATRPAQNAVATESWLHCDQAPTRRGWFCIQGLINMVDVSAETTGTLKVRHGSHKGHEQYFGQGEYERRTGASAESKAQLRDYYQFTAAERPWWEEKYEGIGVAGQAGSMFLWDSRTAHENVSPWPSSDWRHVLYVCYQPRSLAKQQDLEMKQKAYREFRVTTHSPSVNVDLFPTLEESTASYYKDSAGQKPAEQQVQSRPSWTEVRTRDAVENSHILRLAGMQEYPADEVHQSQAFIEMTEEELKRLMDGSCQ